MKTYPYRASNLKSPSLFWPQFHSRSQFLVPAKNRHFSQFIIIIIRDCDNTLYVGLARAVPPTNTNSG